MTTTVVVADDTPLVRTGIVQLLTSEGFDVVAEAADAVSLLDAGRNDEGAASPPNRKGALRGLGAKGDNTGASAGRLVVPPKPVDPPGRSFSTTRGLPDPPAATRRVQAVVRWLESTD